VVGIALGVSLVLVEQQFGWSLRQASPIAAILALLLVGFVLLQTLVRINVPWTLAAPLTYVIIYLFVRAVSPVMMQAITEKVPFVHLLTAVMFLICVWRIGVAIWPNGMGFRASKSDAGYVASLDRGREKDEFRLIRKLRRGSTPEAIRNTARLEHSLEALRKDLSRELPNWTEIAQVSSQLAHKADDVIAIVDRVRVLDRRIRNFDAHELGQLNAYYQQLTPQDRDRLKEQILLERRKIVQECAVDQIADACERRHEQIRHVLDRLGQAAMSEDRTAAVQAAETAVAMEDQQGRELKRLLQAEKLLLATTRRKIEEEARI
jgi:hypothetical protein